MAKSIAAKSITAKMRQWRMPSMAGMAGVPASITAAVKAQTQGRRRLRSLSMLGVLHVRASASAGLLLCAGLWLSPCALGASDAGVY